MRVEDKLERIIVIDKVESYNIGVYKCKFRDEKNQIKILTGSLLVIGKLLVNFPVYRGIDTGKNMCKRILMIHIIIFNLLV